MTSLFPTSQDNIAANIVGSDRRDTPRSHAGHHDDLANAVNAIEAAAVHTGSANQTKTGILTVPIRDKGGQFHNVMAYGAVGNGVADDTAAIQTALTAVGVAGGTLFFPTGLYITSSTLNLPDNIRVEGINGQSGVFGSRIRANFAGYIFTRNTGDIRGPTTFSGLDVTNNHASGGCFYFFNTVLVYIRDCNINAAGTVAVNLAGNNFGAHIDNCTITSSGAYTSVGIAASEHVTVTSCDITAHLVGILVTNVNVVISRCRLEVNKTAIILGQTPAGADAVASDIIIQGCAFEANDTGVYVRHAVATTIQGNGILGSANAPSGGSIYGIRHNFTTGYVLSSWASSGTFSTAALTIESAPDNAAFIGVSAKSNNIANWVVSGGVDLSGTTFISCNYSAVSLITASLAVKNSAGIPDVADNGTIATSGVGVARVNPSAARTGLILAPGTVDGQQVIVLNWAAAANSITFAAAGTSNVADGTSAVIAGLRTALFVWNTLNSRWFRTG